MCPRGGTLPARSNPLGARRRPDASGGRDTLRGEPTGEPRAPAAPSDAAARDGGDRSSGGRVPARLRRGLRPLRRGDAGLGQHLLWRGRRRAPVLRQDPRRPRTLHRLGRSPRPGRSPEERRHPRPFPAPPGPSNPPPCRRSAGRPPAGLRLGRGPAASRRGRGADPPGLLLPPVSAPAARDDPPGPRRDLRGPPPAGGARLDRLRLLRRMRDLRLRPPRRSHRRPGQLPARALRQRDGAHVRLDAVHGPGGVHARGPHRRGHHRLHHGAGGGRLLRADRSPRRTPRGRRARLPRGAGGALPDDGCFP